MSNDLIFNSESLNKSLEACKKTLDLQQENLNKISDDIKKLSFLMKSKCCEFTQVTINDNEFLEWDGYQLNYISETLVVKLLEAKREIRKKCYPKFSELLLKSCGIITTK